MSNTIFLIPDADYKREIEQAIEKSNLLLKENFIIIDPTLLTKQIEDLTRYQQRKKFRNKLKKKLQYFK